jgi:hypothetical protein
LARLTIGDLGNYALSCPAGGLYSVDTSSNAADLNFFVTDSMDPWYQVVGGDIHSNAPDLGPLDLSVRVPVPFTCTAHPQCLPYAILSQRNPLGEDIPDSVGMITHGSGLVDVTSSLAVNTSPVDDKHKDRIVTASFPPFRENYAYLRRLFEFPLQPVNDLSDTATNKPEHTPGNGPNAYYRSGDLHMIPGEPWNVTASESITIFVDGDFYVTQETHVVPGGFLAFVVAGNIYFDADLGSPDPASTAANTEGIFIADGVINIEGNPVGGDKKFVFEGTLVGWGGVNLDRDYDSIVNNAYPSELFTFRPDFTLNTPYEFTRAYFLWQEVAP